MAEPSPAKPDAEPSSSANVAFLSGVRAILRKLPVQTFVDNDARELILKAAQEALDEAIANEEQQMEQQP